MDPQGWKMSKSSGQRGQPHRQSARIRPDAFRIFIADEAPGVNRPYDESKLIGARNLQQTVEHCRYTQGVATPGAKPAVESLATTGLLATLTTCLLSPKAHGPKSL